MTLTRRNVLLGSIAATLGAAAPIRAFPAPAFAPVPGAPLSLDGYYFLHRKNPIWYEAFYWWDFWPFLGSHRWHFDGSTYDQPLISCVANGRVFKIHRQAQYGTMVFEVLIEGLHDHNARDAFSDELAGAARFAAEWACDFPRGRPAGEWRRVFIKGHAGAVYIDFPAEGPPITTDAPPLIIHDRLSLARAYVEAEDFPDDEDEEPDAEEPA